MATTKELAVALRYLPDKYRKAYANGDLSDDDIIQWGRASGVLGEAAPDFSNVKGGTSSVRADGSPVKRSIESLAESGRAGFLSRAAGAARLGQDAESQRQEQEAKPWYRRDLGDFVGMGPDERAKIDASVMPAVYQAAAHPIDAIEQAINPGSQALLRQAILDRANSGATPDMSEADQLSAAAQTKRANAKRALDSIGTGHGLLSTSQQLAESGPTSLVSLIPTPATHVVGSAIAGQDQYYAAYNEARQAGLSPAESRKYAQDAATIEGASEMLPAGKIGAKLPVLGKIGQRLADPLVSNPVTRTLARTGMQAAGEGTEEAASSVGQDLYDTYVASTQDGKLGQYAARKAPLDQNAVLDPTQMASRAVESFKAGALAGGTIGSGHSTFETIAEQGRIHAEALRANEEARRKLAEGRNAPRPAPAAQPAQRDLFGDVPQDNSVAPTPAPEDFNARADRIQGEVRQHTADLFAPTQGELGMDMPQGPAPANPLVDTGPVQSRGGNTYYNPADGTSGRKTLDAARTQAERALADQQAADAKAEQKRQVEEANRRNAADKARKSAFQAERRNRMKAILADAKSQTSDPAEQAAIAAPMIEELNNTFTLDSFQMPEVTAAPAARGRTPVTPTVAPAGAAPVVTPNTPAEEPVTADDGSSPAPQSEVDAIRAQVEGAGLSQQSGNPKTTVTASRVLDHVTSRMSGGKKNQLSKMIADGNVVVVDDIAEIPANAHESSAGVYTGDKTYLVANQVPADNIMGAVLDTLAHETKHAADVGAGPQTRATMGSFIGTEANSRIRAKIEAAAAAGDTVAQSAIDRAKAGSRNEDEFALELPAYFINESRDARGGPIKRIANDIVSSVRTAVKGKIGNADINLNDVAYLSDRLVEQVAREGHRTTGDLNAPLSMYVGENANLSRSEQQDLESAKTMAERGNNEEDIRLNTGWFRGPHDGKWRMEISDRGAKWKIPFDQIPSTPTFGKGPQLTYGEVMDHPELFAKYPWLKDMPFTKKEGFMDVFQSYQGWYTEGNNTQNVTPYARDPLSTSLHETQHAIQGKENWARGGNEEVAFDSATPEQQQRILAAVLDDARTKRDSMADDLRRVNEVVNHTEFDNLQTLHQKAEYLWNQMSGLDPDSPIRKELSTEWYHTKLARDKIQDRIRNDVGVSQWATEDDVADVVNNPTPKNITNTKKSATSQLLKVGDTISAIQTGDRDAIAKILKESPVAHKLYKSIAGEIEARDVQARQHLTDLEREETRPFTSEKFDPKDVIIRYGGEGGSASMTGEQQYWIARGDFKNLLRQFAESRGQTVAELGDSVFIVDGKLYADGEAVGTVQEFLNTLRGTPVDGETVQPLSDVGPLSYTPKALANGLKAMRRPKDKVTKTLKKGFIAFGTLGRQLGNMKENADGSAAMFAHRGMNLFSRTNTGIENLAKQWVATGAYPKKSAAVKAVRDMVDGKMKAISLLPTEAERRSALADMIRRYPQLKPIEEAHQEITQLTRALIKQMLDTNPNPTNDELQLMKTMLNNTYRYTTTMYAAFQGKAGELRNAALMTSYERAKESTGRIPEKHRKAFTIVDNAVRFIIDNDLHIGEYDDLAKLPMDKLMALHNTWLVGDAARVRHNAHRDALANGLTINDAKQAEREVLINNLLGRKASVNADELLGKAEDIVKSMLNLSDNNSTIASYYRNFAQDRGILEHKTHLPEALSELYGEIKDPATLFAVTIAKQGELAARTRLLLDIRDKGVGKWVIPPAMVGTKPEYAQFTETLGGKAFGPLNGYRTTPDLKAAIGDNLEVFNSMSDALNQAYVNSNALVEPTIRWVASKVTSLAAKQKMLSVVWSIYNTGTNALGSPIVLLANGINPLSPVFSAAKQIAGKQGAFMDDAVVHGLITGAKVIWDTATDGRIKLTSDMEEAIKYGILDSARVQEIRRTPQAFVRDLITTQPKAVSIARKWGARASRTGVETFAMSDAWVKIAAFKDRVDTLNKFYAAEGIQKSDTEIKQEAADTVKDTNITYARTGAVVRGVERIGLTTFLPYFVSVPRAVGYNMITGIKDMIRATTATTPQGKMIMGLAGARRAGGAMAATYGSVLLLKALAAAWNGDDDDKLKKAKKLMMPDARFADSFYLGDDEKGLPTFARFSRIDPFGPLTDFMRIAMDDTTPAEDRRREMVTMFKDMMITNRVLIAGSKVAYDVFSDEEVVDKKTKLERVAPGATLEMKNALMAGGLLDYSDANSIMQFIDSFTPGMVNLFDPKNTGVDKATDKESEIMGALISWSGGRLDTADPGISAYIAGKELDTARDVGRKRQAEGLKAGMKTEQLMGMFMEDANNEYIAGRRVGEIYDAMVDGLGMSPKAAEEILKDSGKLKASDISALRQGRVDQTAEDWIKHNTRLLSDKSHKARGRAGGEELTDAEKDRIKDYLKKLDALGYKVRD